MDRSTIEFQKSRESRLRKIQLLRERFPTRKSFINMVLQKMYRFNLTPMQEDMLDFLDTSSSHVMLQAPRGEGKTLLSALDAVYSLIKDPTQRIVIFSGTDDVASEISGYIYDIFHGVEILSFMLPDKSLKDRSSKSAFSVSGYLRPIDKSPSVQCRPIMGGFEGIRADTIIGDDLELMNNSETSTKRDKLIAKIQALEPLLDGSKPNQTIRLLGTPQSTESVYNILPSLDFQIRIWTARIPTVEDIEFYGDHLAPYIRKLYDDFPEKRTGFGLNGDRGAPADPRRYNEEILIRKEQTQSLNGMFDLQYQLNTKLRDKDRYPLKLDKILVHDLDDNKAPMNINAVKNPELQLKLPTGFSVPNAKIYNLMGWSSEEADYDKAVMYIDPSGGGKTTSDELAYSVVKGLNGNVFVHSVRGLRGGYSAENLEHLCEVIGDLWSRRTPLQVFVEDNMGHGMFRTMLQAYLKNKGIRVELEGDYVTSQKETRIISILLPLISSNRLVFNERVIAQDISDCNVYDARTRSAFSLFHQMNFITSQRNALRHDDRLDSLAGALRTFSDDLVTDQEENIKELQKAERISMIRANVHNSDELLEKLGLVKKSGNCTGMSHVNCGRLHKGYNNAKSYKEPNFKNPYEQERYQREQERIAEAEQYKREARIPSTSRYAGTARSFYNKRLSGLHSRTDVRVRSYV